MEKKRKPTVLFVDDESAVLNAIRRSLRKEPWDSYYAQSPEEAMDQLKEHEIDLVVSDHLMPSMDGLSFLKLIKNLYPQIIRVLLTGHANLQLAIEAINDGEVFRFLTKPWNDLEFKVTLKHIFDYIGVLRENQLLLDTVKKQQAFIEKLETDHPGIMEVKRDETGAIILEGLDELLAQKE